MNGHVKKEPAGHTHVFDWRRRGVAADDVQQVRCPYLPFPYRLPYPREVRVKPAVETDLQLHAGFFHGGQGAVDALQILRDGLLAENVFA